VFAAGARRVSQLDGDGPIDAGKHANIAQPSPSCRNIIVSRDARNVLAGPADPGHVSQSMRAQTDKIPSSLPASPVWLMAYTEISQREWYIGKRALLIQDHNFVEELRG